MFHIKFILKLLFIVNKNCIKKIIMKMNNGDMEAFRKRLKFVIPSMKKSEIVKHFERKESHEELFTLISNVCKVVGLSRTMK